MKTFINNFAIFTLTTLVTLTSCQQNEAEIEPQDQQVTAATTVSLNTAEFRVVQNFINAINTNDRAAAAPLVSANTGYAYSLTGTLNTGASFQSWLESDLFGPRAIINIQSATQTGNVVRIQGMWGRNGNATSRADYHFTVENGVITAWRLV